MSYFIDNYKGGTNESFMFGGENKTKQKQTKLWFDFYLTAAYNTGKA